MCRWFHGCLPSLSYKRNWNFCTSCARRSGICYLCRVGGDLHQSLIPTCHPERSRSFGEWVKRDDPKPRATRSGIYEHDCCTFPIQSNIRQSTKFLPCHRRSRLTAPAYGQVRLRKRFAGSFAPLRMTRRGEPWENRISMLSTQTRNSITNP